LPAAAQASAKQQIGKLSDVIGSLKQSMNQGNNSRSSSKKGKKHRRRGRRSHHNIYTVKNIDTGKLRTNSYLSRINSQPKSRYRSKSKNYNSFPQKLDNLRNVEYKIKSYANVAGESGAPADVTKADAGYFGNKHYTVKDSSAAGGGCGGQSCG
jgi:phage repressor protein C with HTH and peptisase S24 domain